MTEGLATYYASDLGLRVTVMRVFSVVGPGQRRLLPYELWLQAVSAGDAVSVRGTGQESRDYLHVTDLASAIVGLAQTDAPSGLVNCVNLASGIETKVSDIAEFYQRRFAPDKRLMFQGEVSDSDPSRWCADISKVRALLPDWQPRGLPDALAACAQLWLRTLDHLPAVGREQQ